MMKSQAAIDAATNAGWSLKTMAGGGAASLMGWIMSSGMFSLLGAIVSIIGALATLWFKWHETKENKRQRELEMALKHREDYRREMIFRAQMKKHGIPFDWDWAPHTQYTDYTEDK